jgi:cytochrome c553
MKMSGWILAAVMACLPIAAFAAEGNPADGKAKAESLGCNACHGPEGVANQDGLAIEKNMPNLAGEPDLYLQFQLVYFRKGTRKNDYMTAIAQSLSDADIRDLGAYFASLPAANAAPPADPAPEDTSLGAKVAQGLHCSNCHGDHFEGQENMGRLAGQREDYLYKALRDFKGGARVATGAASMAEVVYPLGDLEMKALAHYMSRLGK